MNVIILRGHNIPKQASKHLSTSAFIKVNSGNILLETKPIESRKDPKWKQRFHIKMYNVMGIDFDLYRCTNDESAKGKLIAKAVILPHEYWWRDGPNKYLLPLRMLNSSHLSRGDPSTPSMLEVVMEIIESELTEEQMALRQKIKGLHAKDKRHDQKQKMTKDEQIKQTEIGNECQKIIDQLKMTKHALRKTENELKQEQNARLALEEKHTLAEKEIERLMLLLKVKDEELKASKTTTKTII